MQNQLSQLLHGVPGCSYELCGVISKHKTSPPQLQVTSRADQGTAAGLPAATTLPLTFWHGVCCWHQGLFSFARHSGHLWLQAPQFSFLKERFKLSWWQWKFSLVTAEQNIRIVSKNCIFMFVLRSCKKWNLWFESKRRKCSVVCWCKSVVGGILTSLSCSKMVLRCVAYSGRDDVKLKFNLI